jgi:hypothetical protein
MVSPRDPIRHERDDRRRIMALGCWALKGGRVMSQLLYENSGNTAPK